VRYLDMPPQALREQYWAWRRLLEGALGMRAARSAGRCLRRVELIQAIARKRRIRLGPPIPTGRRGPGRLEPPA
jgi:hypothetical protein